MLIQRLGMSSSDKVCWESKSKLCFLGILMVKSDQRSPFLTTSALLSLRKKNLLPDLDPKRKVPNPLLLLLKLQCHNKPPCNNFLHKLLHQECLLNKYQSAVYK